MEDDSFFANEYDSGTQRGGGLNGAETDWQTALRPVTIRQILDCQRLHSSAPFTIDGREAKNISLVAAVVRETIHSNTGKVRYELEDSTIERQHEAMSIYAWRACEVGGIDSVGNNCYIRITGYLSQSGRHRPSINILSLRKVTDPHEVFYHILSTITTSMCYERGKPGENILRSLSARASVVQEVPSSKPDHGADSRMHPLPSNASLAPPPNNPYSSAASASNQIPTATNPQSEASIPMQPPGLGKASTRSKEVSRKDPSRGKQAQARTTTPEPTSSRRAASTSKEASETEVGQHDAQLSPEPSEVSGPCMAPADEQVKSNRTSDSIPKPEKPTPSKETPRRNPPRTTRARPITPTSTSSRRTATPDRPDQASEGNHDTQPPYQKPESPGPEMVTAPVSVKRPNKPSTLLRFPKATVTSPKPKRSATPSVRVAEGNRIFTGTERNDIMMEIPSTARITSPSPSPSPRARTAENRSRRLSRRDPLSHLSPLQRNIMLELLDPEKLESPERGMHAKALAHSFRDEEGISSLDIATALDELLEQGLVITTDEECQWYRATDTKGKGKAAQYDFSLD